MTDIKPVVKRTFDLLRKDFPRSGHTDYEEWVAQIDRWAAYIEGLERKVDAFTRENPEAQSVQPLDLEKYYAGRRV